LLKIRRFFVSLLLVIALGSAILSACSPSRAGDGPKLVYFRASNCPYCKQMTPVVNEIEQKYGRQVDIVYAEVDQQDGKDLARRYGIIGYPTVLLLDSSGERFGLLRGVVPLASLEKAVDDLLQEGQ
jgi:thioredoxin 1